MMTQQQRQQQCLCRVHAATASDAADAVAASPAGAAPAAAARSARVQHGERCLMCEQQRMQLHVTATGMR